MATDAGKSVEIEAHFVQTPGFPKSEPLQNGGAFPISSGRRLIERRACRIARNWRARRQLLVRDLHPSVVDAMRAWSQAEARLELADEREAWGDRWVTACQSSAARLRRDLEKALKENPPLPSLLTRRSR